MTKYADVLAAYQRLRLIRFDLNNTLVGTLGKQAIDEGGRTLGLLQGGTLVLESEEEMPALMDYCIHNYRSGGRNAVQKYLAESPPPPNSEEMAVLKAMLNAYYSLFQILDVERGVGVTVLDLLRGDTVFLTDIGFGNTARKDMILAARVIPMEGFLMTSGASLPVTPPAMEQIKAELERTFAPGTDFTRLRPQQDAALAALVIRSCLASGVASRFTYELPGQEPSRRKLTGVVPERPRANRNDPCPCGSGKKFKSCCGRR